MAKNLIPEIAKLLGVELGEEFKVEGDNRTYWFDLDGLLVSDDDAEKVYTATHVPLVGLVRGNSEIIKLPWKPKKGELYYSFGFRNCPKWGVSQQNWGNHPCDYALLDKGWIYRTRAEAEAALPAVAKELGVEYEL